MIAVPLIFGRLTAGDYEDGVAKDPRIDATARKDVLRRRQEIHARLPRPGQALDRQRAHGRVQGRQKLEEVVCEYPIGHKRRRKEGMPVLVEKFKTNLARRFPAEAAAGDSRSVPGREEAGKNAGERIRRPVRHLKRADASAPHRRAARARSAHYPTPIARCDEAADRRCIEETLAPIVSAVRGRTSRRAGSRPSRVWAGNARRRACAAKAAASSSNRVCQRRGQQPRRAADVFTGDLRRPAYKGDMTTQFVPPMHGMAESKMTTSRRIARLLRAGHEARGAVAARGAGPAAPALPRRSPSTRAARSRPTGFAASSYREGVRARGRRARDAELPVLRTGRHAARHAGAARSTIPPIACCCGDYVASGAHRNGEFRGLQAIEAPTTEATMPHNLHNTLQPHEGRQVLLAAAAGEGPEPEDRAAADFDPHRARVGAAQLRRQEGHRGARAAARQLEAERDAHRRDPVRAGAHRAAGLHRRAPALRPRGDAQRGAQDGQGSRR